MQTDITKFKNPHSTRNKLGRVLWTVAWGLLFRPTPKYFGQWRTFLLRLFGARIGRAWLHQSVEVWAPWMLEIGHDVFIDRDVKLYNTYGTTIGDRVVISRGTMLCTPSHDHTLAEFPLIGGRITIGSDVWVAAEAFVAPGITIHDGAVVGARGVVVRDVPRWTIVAGNPARVIRARELKTAANAAATAPTDAARTADAARLATGATGPA